MGPEAWMTLIVVLVVLGLMVTSRRAPDVLIWGGVVLLMVIPVPGPQGWQFGVLTPARALAGLANEGVVTVGLLFLVAAGLRDTGGLSSITQRMLGRPRSLGGAQLRIMGPTAVISAFLNNTPLVAMLLPVVDEWSRKQRLSVSKLLIPLSFASILGGACTLIGTSTNLIINGWLIEHGGGIRLTLFEPAWVALPVAVVGIAYLLVTSRWLLPDRRPPISPSDDARRYTVEMRVPRGSPLAGRSIEDAGLRHLPGLYLIEIQRGEQVLPAVSPTEKLEEEDQLIFAGVVDSVVDLQKIRGLVPATTQVFKLDEPRANRMLVEAVVSSTCPLVGRTVREGRFRSTYNAAVIAVARDGEWIHGKIGDISLQPGDTLLLEAPPSFVEQQRYSRDFYLVSPIRDSSPPRFERAWVALTILGLLVLSIAAGWLSTVQAAGAAALLMVLTGCCRAAAARRSVDWQTLLVMAGALGLGSAMEVSGLAAVLGDALLTLAGDGPMLTLAAVYFLAMVLASVITAKAAAVLVLPIAAVAAGDLGVSLLPFVMAVLIAASTSIATPIGYPTNLMIYGPGGYRFSDYLKVGGPLTLLIALMAIVLIPNIWAFT